MEGWIQGIGRKSVTQGLDSLHVSITAVAAAVISIDIPWSWSALTALAPAPGAVHRRATSAIWWALQLHGATNSVLQRAAASCSACCDRPTMSQPHTCGRQTIDRVVTATGYKVMEKSAAQTRAQRPPTGVAC
jgi:hypothetical protein